MSLAMAGAAVFTSSTKTSYVVARDVEYLGTTLFVGGLAFVSLLWPAGAQVRRARVLLMTGWVIAFIGTLAALVLEGAWAAQLPAGSALHTAVVKQVLATPFGREWAVKALLWLLALIVLADVLRRGQRAVTSLPWRLGALAVGLAILRISGLTGHTQDTARPVIAQLADIVHLTAISVWIGGLTMLVVGVLPARRPDELRRVVPAFSLLAMGCITAIVASGVMLAWRIAGSLHEVTSTTYGHLLLLKLALVAVVLALGFGSKTWTAHRLDFAVVLRGEAGLVRPFVRSVAAETAVVVAVLSVASFLVTSDPGR